MSSPSDNYDIILDKSSKHDSRPKFNYGPDLKDRDPLKLLIGYDLTQIEWLEQMDKKNALYGKKNAMREILRDSSLDLAKYHKARAKYYKLNKNSERTLYHTLNSKYYKQRAAALSKTILNSHVASL